MNISLAGLGWLTDAPAGNRLRWSYPLLASDSADDYLGLPKTIIVERAWLDEDIPQQIVQGKTASAPSMPLPPIPVLWWNSYGDVHPTGFLQTVHQLPRPVQAARFTYRGTKARLRVYDSAANALVAERIIDDGDLFNLEAPVIDRFEVLAISPTFQNFMTLDLFVDRGLPWEEIAHIRVADTVNFDLEQVKLRYDLPPTLTPQEWKEFVNMAVIGQASNPSTLVKGNPTAWEAFSV